MSRLSSIAIKSLLPYGYRSALSQLSKYSIVGHGKLFYSTESPNYRDVLVERAGKRKNVGIIRLNRPKALNALCDNLMQETKHAFATFDDDPEIGCIVFTGIEKAFAGKINLVIINS